MSSKSRKKSNSDSSSVKQQALKTHTPVSAFNITAPFGAMPKLDNIEIDTVIEKLNEYCDIKTQCDINLAIIKNFLNFLAIYISGFQSGDGQNRHTKFETDVFDESVYAHSESLKLALGINKKNLRTSVQEWRALHERCIALMTTYAEKAAELEERILALRAKLKEPTDKETTMVTRFGGGRKKKYSLKKKGEPRS